MGTFDLVLLVLLGVGALKGYRHGFTIELFSFLAFFIGLYLALQLTIPVTIRLFGSSSYFDFIAIFVFIVLFILISVGIKSAARVIKGSLELTPFGMMDRALGTVLGILKLAFILSVIFWVFDSLGIDIVESYADGTIIFPYIESIGPKVFEWMSYVLPFIDGLMEDLQNLPNQQDTFVTFRQQ